MTVGNKQPELRNSHHIPARTEINARFLVKAGGNSLLMKHLIAGLAEEAEKMMHQIILPDLQIVRISKVPYSSKNQKPKKNSYRCPVCKYQNVRLASNFCPNCGKPIEWY